MLSGLAQESRLSLFRLLVQQGPEGMSAGDISSALGVAPTLLSFHLKELSHAGLIKSRKEGRFIYYSPDFKAMNSLLGYLTENCCAGSKAKAGCSDPALCDQA